jgi:hypothetical protein
MDFEGTELVESYGRCFEVYGRGDGLRPNALYIADYLLKMIVIGEAGSGKTCCVGQFIHGSCEWIEWAAVSTSPTRANLTDSAMYL